MKKLSKKEFAENEAGYASGYAAGVKSMLPLVEKLQATLQGAFDCYVGQRAQNQLSAHIKKVLDETEKFLEEQE